MTKGSSGRSKVIYPDRFKRPDGRRIKIAYPEDIDIDEAVRRAVATSSWVTARPSVNLPNASMKRNQQQIAHAVAARRVVGSNSRQRVQLAVEALKKQFPRITRDKAAERICREVGLSFHRTVKLLTSLKCFRRIP